MNAQHTPGPWEAGSSSQIVFDTVCRPVATVAKNNMKANARLIATAPCLLRSLEQMVELVKSYHKDAGGCDHSVGICLCGEYAWVKEAEAAIAKAKGA